MNKTDSRPWWQAKPLLLIGYVVYVVVAVFSLYAFGSYAVVDRFGVAVDQLLIVRLTSIALGLATLASLLRVTRMVIAAAKDTTPSAGRRSTRAIVTSFTLAALMIAGFLILTVWFYNLH